MADEVSKKIKFEIEIEVNEFKQLYREEVCDIEDEAEFEKFLNSDRFKENVNFLFTSALDPDNYGDRDDTLNELFDGYLYDDDDDDDDDDVDEE